ncbi:MAG TPA: PDGLE domain-containing protein [Candidatus Lokiarchaeia archaeon]|nr:PDGLE domain-containing protein [Candidatus Lokiarchaeia archaeon]
MTENGEENTPTPAPKRKALKGWGLILIILIITAPLGIIAAGTAYGEWGSDELQSLLGYVPSGVSQGENLWHAPLSNYGANLGIDPNVGYWIAAAVGVCLIVVVAWGVGRIVARKEARRNVSA